MIETFNELMKESPKSVKQWLNKGFDEQEILKMYQVEYMDLAACSVNHIRIIEVKE